MANKIQLKRGLKSRLSTLSAGEPAFTTDTRELFLGTGSGNVNMSGNKWYNGTAMNGTSTSTTYTYSACPLVKLGDMYLNTTTGGVYECTTAGSGTAARWTYRGSLKGADADVSSVENELITYICALMPTMDSTLKASCESYMKSYLKEKYLLPDVYSVEYGDARGVFCYPATGYPKDKIVYVEYSLHGDGDSDYIQHLWDIDLDIFFDICTVFGDRISAVDECESFALRLKGSKAYFLYKWN